MPSLVPHWRGLLLRSWSSLILVLAFVTSAAEIALPTFLDDLGLSQRASDALMGLLVAAAFVARLFAQRSVSGGSDAGR